MKKCKIVLPYAVAVVLCMVVSLPILSESVVLDEAYSITLVRGTVGEIIHGTAGDVHPPLYYLLLKLSAAAGGESLVKYRLVTALATYLNLLWLGAGLIRRRWGGTASVLYLLWYGASYCTVEMSTYVRMYSWGSFFVTATSLFLFAYYEKRRTRDLAMGTLLTLGAMYCHYYAAMAVFTAWLILLAVVLLRSRREVWKLLLCGAGIALGYAPWLGVLLRQSGRVSQNYWIKGFDWREWISTPALLMDNSLEGVGAAMCFLLTALAVRAILRRKGAALAALAVFLGTMLIGAALSLAVAPIWVPRYLYVAWGMLSLFAALAIGEDKGPQTFLLQMGCLVLLCVMGYFSVRMIQREDVMTSTASEWTAYLEENVEADACLIVDDPYEHILVYRYYLPQARIVMVEELTGMGGERSLSDILAQEGQIWYILDEVQPRCGVTQMSEWLEAEGFAVEQRAYFTLQDKRLEIFSIGERAHGE